MSNNKKKKGFTLIELIIVIAILGIIAAIAVPKFGSIQKDAKVKSDISSAKVIYDAVLQGMASNTIASASDAGVSTLDTYLQKDPEVQLFKSAKFVYDILDDEVIVKIEFTADEGDFTKGDKKQVYPKPDNTSGNPYY